MKPVINISIKGNWMTPFVALANCNAAPVFEAFVSILGIYLTLCNLHTFMGKKSTDLAGKKRNDIFHILSKMYKDYNKGTLFKNIPADQNKRSKDIEEAMNALEGLLYCVMGFSASVDLVGVIGNIGHKTLDWYAGKAVDKIAVPWFLSPMVNLPFPISTNIFSFGASYSPTLHPILKFCILASFCMRFLGCLQDFLDFNIKENKTSENANQARKAFSLVNVIAPSIFMVLQYIPNKFIVSGFNVLPIACGVLLYSYITASEGEDFKHKLEAICNTCAGIGVLAMLMPAISGINFTKIPILALNIITLISSLYGFYKYRDKLKHKLHIGDINNAYTNAGAKVQDKIYATIKAMCECFITKPYNRAVDELFEHPGTSFKNSLPSIIAIVAPLLQVCTNMRYGLPFMQGVNLKLSLGIVLAQMFSSGMEKVKFSNANDDLLHIKYNIAAVGSTILSSVLLSDWVATCYTTGQVNIIKCVLSISTILVMNMMTDLYFFELEP